jgi:hypothetical protein
MAIGVSVNQIYSFIAVITTLYGTLALVAGVPIEVVEPIVVTGAIIVGIINVYWLFGGSGAYSY